MNLRSLPGGLALLVSTLSSSAALAQAENRTNDINSHAWYQHFGDHRLSKHWGFHTEAQFRRASLLLDKQQLLLRTGINFILNDQVMLTVGYGFIETYPYGEYPAKAAFPEHRIYEQVVFNPQPLGRLALNHRYRLEQRFITFPGTTEAKRLNRIRYQVRGALPLNRPKMEPGALYLYGYDEIFIGFGRNVAYNIFDQNRFGGGLGYKFTKVVALESGYMSQIVQQRNGNVFEYNNTFTASLTVNFDLRRPEPTPSQ